MPAPNRLFRISLRSAFASHTKLARVSSLAGRATRKATDRLGMKKVVQLNFDKWILAEVHSQIVG